MHPPDTQDPFLRVETAPGAPVAIRDQDEAEASLGETRTRIAKGQQEARSAADTVERARRFLEEYWTRRDNCAAPDLGATTSAGLDLQLQSFVRSIDDLVACLRDASRRNARDCAAVNQLNRRLRAIEE
jgi:hypothetical protein